MCDSNEQCVSQHEICDHFPHCSDKSDEIRCSRANLVNQPIPYKFPSTVQPKLTTVMSRRSSYSQGPNSAINFYNPVHDQATVFDYPNFDPMTDSEQLRRAMKGFGCDSESIMNILCYRSNQQRQHIRQSYKQMFGRDLMRDLISELGGNFENLMVALLYPPWEYDAVELRHAVKGAGTNEATLIEIMTSRSNQEIAWIKYSYKKLFQRDLEADIRSDTSFNFKKLMTSLCTGARDESGYVDQNRAQMQAQQLYQAGEKRWGTDEPVFNSIMATQSYLQLQCIFQSYYQQTRHDIERAISKEFSGDIKDGLLAIVKVAKNRPVFFAEQLYKSMKGLGTNDRKLIRLVVSRSERDMSQIAYQYHVLYGRTLKKDIWDDTSGKYRMALLKLIGAG